MSVEGKVSFIMQWKRRNFTFCHSSCKRWSENDQFIPDNNKGVWVFPYSSPFLHINKQTKEISRFNLEDEETFMYNAGEISDVFPDPGNILLVATSQKGLIAINTINKTHRVLLDKDEHGDPVFVRCIERIDPNTLWIGTESGIYIYHSDTEEVIN